MTTHKTEKRRKKPGKGGRREGGPVRGIQRRQSLSVTTTFQPLFLTLSFALTLPLLSSNVCSVYERMVCERIHLPSFYVNLLSPLFLCYFSLQRHHSVLPLEHNSIANHSFSNDGSPDQPSPITTTVASSTTHPPLATPTLTQTPGPRPPNLKCTLYEHPILVKRFFLAIGLGYLAYGVRRYCLLCRKVCSLGVLNGVDVAHQVHQPVGVAPLVVVPADYFDEGGVEHNTGLGIEDR